MRAGFQGSGSAGNGRDHVSSAVSDKQAVRQPFEWLTDCRRHIPGE
jgi:hypothetical protein